MSRSSSSWVTSNASEAPFPCVANCSIWMSPFELPAAKIGRAPIRLQIRTTLFGPSSNTSSFEVWTSLPMPSSSRYCSATLVPTTRSGGTPYSSRVIGRMKSRPPPDTM